MNANAICGECGKRFKEHRQEENGEDTYLMCQDDFNEFTDLPKDRKFIEFLIARNSDLMSSELLAWRLINGH